MSMSKAMATQCSGEVFLLTMTDLKQKADVPEDGIWWQVEFPTLIDETRAGDKKVTKVSTSPPPPPRKLARQWVLINTVDHIPPSTQS